MFFQNVGICLPSTGVTSLKSNTDWGSKAIPEFEWQDRGKITKDPSHENLSPGRNSNLRFPDNVSKARTPIFVIERALGLFYSASFSHRTLPPSSFWQVPTACQYAYGLVTTKIPSSLHPVPLPSPQSNYTSYTRATGEILPVYLITHARPLRSSHSCTLHASYRNSRPFHHDDHCLSKVHHFNLLNCSGYNVHQLR